MALQKLKNVRIGTIDKGLVRVDIMMNDNGNLVVNEFESLEAKIEANEIEVQDSLRHYYYNHLIRLSHFMK